MDAIDGVNFENGETAMVLCPRRLSRTPTASLWLALQDLASACENLVGDQVYGADVLQQSTYQNDGYKGVVFYGPV
jgi:hypothetical protein